MVRSEGFGSRSDANSGALRTGRSPASVLSRPFESRHATIKTPREKRGVFMVRPEGFEPPKAASKAAVISISPRAQKRLL